MKKSQEAEKTVEPKAKKIWFKTWWGIIIAVLFFLWFGLYYVYYIWRHHPERSVKRKSLVTAAILIPWALFVWALVASWGTPSLNNFPKLTNQATLKVAGTTSWQNAKIEVLVNDTKVKEYNTVSGKVEAEVPLKEGENVVVVKATNEKGKTQSSKYTVTLDTKAPPLEVTKYPQATEDKKIEVEGTSENEAVVKALKSDKEMAKKTVDDKKFKLTGLELTKGENKLRIVSVDKAGNETSKEIVIIYTPDEIPPVLEITKADPNSEKDKTIIQGRAEPNATVKLYRDGKEVAKQTKINGEFVFTNVALNKGDNKFKVVASDKAGNETKKEFVINYTPKVTPKTTTPAPAAAPKTTTPAAPTTPKQDSSKELDAQVRYNTYAFQITNNETVGWTNCKMTINSGLFSGWSLNGNIPAKDSLIMAYRDFTKGDGSRFDSYSTKIKTLSINCSVNGTTRFGSFTMPN
jgi:hypothetical protein